MDGIMVKKFQVYDQSLMFFYGLQIIRSIKLLNQRNVNIRLSDYIDVYVDGSYNIKNK